MNYAANLFGLLDTYIMSVYLDRNTRISFCKLTAERDSSVPFYVLCTNDANNRGLCVREHKKGFLTKISFMKNRQGNLCHHKRLNSESNSFKRFENIKWFWLYELCVGTRSHFLQNETR